MKKLFTSLMLFMAGALVNTAMAESYGLKVAGIQVTDANKSNIKGTGISGTVTYNPNTKTLTLKNATITSDGTNDGIYNSGIEDLYINFEGNVTITTNSSGNNVAGIYCSKNTTLIRVTGARTPKVKVTNTGAGPAIRSYDGSTIKLFAVNLTATANNYHAIYAGSAAELRVLVSTLTATANNSSYYAIMGFKQGLSTTFSDCPLAVFGNQDHSFDKSTGCVVKNGTPVSSTTLYPPILIGDEALSYNVPTITTTTTGATSVSGEASFNCYAPDPKLTLKDFSMNGAKITVRLPNLKIEVNGTCSITNANNALDIYADTKILGSGTLNLTSTSYAAISTYNRCEVRMGVSMLKAQGKTFAFYGEKSGTLWLTKPQNTNFYYRFAGESKNIYTGNLKLTGIDFYTGNSYWKPSDGYVYFNDSPAHSSTIDNGTWFATTNLISYHDLYVGGTHVRQNCVNYITSPYITSGTVKYNHNSKTLTLNGVTINMPESEKNITNTGIYSGISDLKISTVGSNNITAKYCGMIICTNTSISGSSLNITSEENAAITVFQGSKSSLTLELSSTAASAFKGKTYGFEGDGNSSLIINKGSSGTLYKFAGENGNIGKIKSLNLGTGVKIHSRWTWYNEEAKAVYVTDGIAKANDLDYGTWIRGDVTWTEYPIYICGEQLYGAYVNGVYRGNIYGFYNKYTTYNSNNSNISYDPGSNELRLRDVTIDYTGTDKTNIGIIQTDANVNLNIVNAGDNTLSSQTAYSALWLRESNCTIKGDGTLNTSSKFCDIYPMQGTELNFQGNVTVNAPTKGIWSNNGTNSMLVHGNATINAKNIYSIDELILGNNHAITQPAGATFSNRAVRLNGSLAQNVVIMPIPQGDVNADGFVDIADVVAVLNAMAGNPVPGNANVNGDIDVLGMPVVDIADVVAVLSIMAGNK